MSDGPDCQSERKNRVEVHLFVFSVYSSDVDNLNFNEFNLRYKSTVAILFADFLIGIKLMFFCVSNLFLKMKTAVVNIFLPF